MNAASEPQNNDPVHTAPSGLLCPQIGAAVTRVHLDAPEEAIEAASRPRTGGAIRIPLPRPQAGTGGSR